jgi:hypothetical protein
MVDDIISLYGSGMVGRSTNGTNYW